jgi:hypothetical protein
MRWCLPAGVFQCKPIEPAPRLLDLLRNKVKIDITMLYMVVERFKDAPEIYRRLREKGRMMPEGLDYISSWIDHDFKVCWQLMKTEDFALLERWIDNWKDLMDFEIVPVRSSAEVREMMSQKL